MAIVNITASFEIEPQEPAVIQQIDEVYSRQKATKRSRDDAAFKHVIIHKPDSRLVFLISAKGKVVSLGARSKTGVAKAASWISKGLKTKLIRKPQITNIVYSHKIGKSLDLETIYSRITLNQFGRFAASFEPELSPAIIYYLRSAPISKKCAKALIFRSGTINITGFSDPSYIPKMLKELDEILSPNY